MHNWVMFTQWHTNLAVFTILLTAYVMRFFLLEVSRFNAQQVPERFVDIAKAMGVDVSAMTQEQAVNAALEAIDALSEKVGTKQRLGDLGVTEDKLAFMAQNALNDACSLTNPRKASLEEIIAIFKARM